eukprot:COSAG06_NODE_2431_length_6889_cov_345.528424_3_plen_50_part_00
MGGYLKRLFSTGISCRIHEEALPLVSVASTRAGARVKNRESRWLHVVGY